MTTTNKTRLVTVTAQGRIIIRGKDAKPRLEAFEQVAPLAFADGQSRGAIVAAIDVVIGPNPTDEHLKAVQIETVSGRAAQRLAEKDFPFPNMTMAQKIDFMREQVMYFAYPLKDGVDEADAKTLEARFKGRRSIAVQKVIRAAESAFVHIKAELGFSVAQTLAMKNAAAAKALTEKIAAETAAKLAEKEAAKEAKLAKKEGREPRMAGSTDKGKGDATPSHADLAKPVATTAQEAVDIMVAHAKLGVDLANKHAGPLPQDFGTAAIAYQKAVTKALALFVSVQSVN